MPQRIEEKRQKDAEQSKPAAYPSLPVTAVPPSDPDEMQSWNNREPLFSMPTLMPDVPNRPGGGVEAPDDPNPGEEPSAEPSDKRNSARENADEPPESSSSASAVVSLVIIVGVLFLLVNICAFGGIYYQRDKLRVRERLFNNRSVYSDLRIPRTAFTANVSGGGGGAETSRCVREDATMVRSRGT